MAVTSGTVAGFEQTSAATPWTAVSITIASGCTRVDALLSWESNVVITDVQLDGAAMQEGPTVGPVQANVTRMRHYWMDNQDAGWPGVGTFDVVVTPVTEIGGYICIWPLHGAAAGAAARSNPATSTSTNSLAVTLENVLATSACLSGSNFNNSGIAVSIAGGDLRFADDDAFGGQTTAFGDTIGSSGTVTHTHSLGGGGTRGAVLMVEILEAATRKTFLFRPA